MKKYKITVQHTRDRQYGDTYRRAGLSLSAAAQQHEVDEAQLAALEADTFVRIVNKTDVIDPATADTSQGKSKSKDKPKDEGGDQ